MKITDAVIRDHMPPKGAARVEISDTGMPGLSIRLADGKGTWTYRTPRLPDGTRPRVELGYWPATKAGDARIAAQHEKQKTRATGKTTNSERREAVAAARKRRFLADLAEEYCLIKKANADEENRNVRKAIEEYGLGKLAPSEVTIKHVKAVANSPHAAIKRYGAMSRFFDHLVEDEEQAIEVNPFKMLSKKSKPKPQPARTGKYDAKQLQAIWFGADDLSEPFNRFVKFDLLTLLRRTEAASILRKWIGENGVLTIPGKIMKNGEEYQLPLAPIALQLVAQGPESGPLFPSRKTGRPICGWKPLGAFFRKLGVEEGGLHNFRRTAASALGERGFAVDVVDGILAHRQSASRAGVIGTYNQSTQMQEHRRALATWEATLRHCVEFGEFPPIETEERKRAAGGNVVPFQP